MLEAIAASEDVQFYWLIVTADFEDDDDDEEINLFYCQ